MGNGAAAFDLYGQLLVTDFLELLNFRGDDDWPEHLGVELVMFSVGVAEAGVHAAADSLEIADFPGRELVVDTISEDAVFNCLLGEVEWVGREGHGGVEGGVYK